MQLSPPELWTPTITSGSIVAPRTGPSAPLSGTRWSTPPGAGPITPTDVLEGTPARSCSASILQCVDGAFCQPMPEEMVDQGMSFGPKYVAIEQLADQARSIRPAAKRVKAMEQREELDAAGRVKTLEGARAGLEERQAGVDAEIAQLLSQAHPGETETQGRDPRRRFPPAAEGTS